MRFVLRHHTVDFNIVYVFAFGLSIDAGVNVHWNVCVCARDGRRCCCALLLLGLLRAVVGGGRVAAAARDEVERIHGVLGHVALVRRLHVVLHLVGTRELLLAHRTREHLSRRALVVQERVPLEAVFVLERLLDILLCAFRALIDAVVDFRIAEEIESAHRHFRQVFRLVIRLGVPLPPDASALGLPSAWRCGRCDDCVGGLGQEKWLLLGPLRMLLMQLTSADGRRAGGRRETLLSICVVVVDGVRLPLVQHVRHVRSRRTLRQGIHSYFHLRSIRFTVRLYRQQKHICRWQNRTIYSITIQLTTRKN